MSERPVMFFFGGAQSAQRTVPLDAQHTLIYRYTFLHLFWFIRWAFRGRYELATLTDHGWMTRPVSAEEARRMAGPQMPATSPWDRWSLAVVIALIAVVIVFRMMGG